MCRNARVHSRRKSENDKSERDVKSFLLNCRKKRVPLETVYVSLGEATLCDTTIMRREKKLIPLSQSFTDLN